jgi:hypothetical protein
MKNEELIALYFEEKLNAEQKVRFDDLIQNDEKFKAKFTFEAQLKKAIISTKKDELRNKLKQLEQPKKRINYYAILAIAASLIIALGVFSLMQPSSSVSNDALFAQHFEPYSNIIAPTTRGEDKKDSISEAFRYYDAKHYKIASKKFKTLYTKTNTSYYLFYQGICELQLGNTETAIILFKTHQNYTDKLSSQTKWYLALAYLKANNTNEAKGLLKNIVTKKSYKYEASEVILKKLK